MENKINLVEILKDCPKGMELDCPLLDNVEFEELDFNFHNYPIVIRNSKTNAEIYLTEYGQFVNEENYKCIIFPKGKNTWEGFVPPIEFKEGDIIYTLLESDLKFISIFKKASETLIYTYVALGSTLYRGNMNGLCKKNDIKLQRLATEEEKAELFKAIKENGYKWNAENKSLEKLIEPKFKVGDRIRLKNGGSIIEVTSINNDGSICVNGMSWTIKIEQQDNYELVPDKFDTTTLVPFESKMLVRSADGDLWKPAVYGFFSYKGMYVVGGIFWTQYIPYEGNEHLLGTSNDCSEFYKTWK